MVVANAYVYANNHAVSHPFRCERQVGEAMVEFTKGVMPIVVLAFLLRSSYGKEVTERARQMISVVGGFGVGKDSNEQQHFFSERNFAE